MPYHVYIRYDILPPVVPTTDQKRAIARALRSMGRQSDPSPALITQIRPNLAETSAIMEVTIDNPVPPLGEIQDDAYQRIADETGFSLQQVMDNSDFTLFRDNEDDAKPARDVTWQESRLATVAYLIANLSEWEEPLP